MTDYQQRALEAIVAGAQQALDALNRMPSPLYDWFVRGIKTGSVEPEQPCSEPEGRFSEVHALEGAALKGPASQRDPE